MRQKGIPVVAAAPGCPDIKDSSCLYKAQKGKVYLPNSGRTLNEELIKRGLRGRLRNREYGQLGGL